LPAARCRRRPSDSDEVKIRAIVIHAPRDLRVEDFDIATPAPREISVRIRASGICGSYL
jgi:L-idonate 5-dehydrogenase